MPTFSYKAYDRSGRSTTGDIEAEGLRQARERLRADGLIPAEITEAGLKGAAPGRAWTRKISSSVLALTTRQLGTLLASGSNLSEALEVVASTTENRTLKAVLANVRDDVVEGRSLSGAMEDHPAVFSSFYRGLVAAGEASGTLDGSLARLADYLEARARIIQETKSALTYPILMTLVGTLVVAFLFIFVMPRIIRIFEDTEAALPLITQVLVGVTGIVSTWWPLGLVIIAAGAKGASMAFKNPATRARIDSLVLKAPWLGRLATGFYVANLSRTLGSLLKSGVPLLKALEVTRGAVNNSVYEKLLTDAAADCTEGSPLSTSLKKHPPVPRVLTHMAAIGERSGTLDDMLLKAADTFEQEYSAEVKRALTLLEPLLVLAMGVVVGFLVLAIILPIFQLNQMVG